MKDQLNEEEIGLNILGEADPNARPLEIELPDILVFDTDSKRMGDYGGFFLAEDCNAAAYTVEGASLDPKARERVNGPRNRIPGVHLPELVHFALVAAGPLFTVKEPGEGSPKEVFHFEAIAFCREVKNRETGETALLKLTIKGPAAVKLHHYLTIGITGPLRRMTDHYHDLAKQLYNAQKISRERFEHLMRAEATAQMLWAPVEIRRGKQIGRSEEKSVIGAMLFTDEPDGKPNKFKSRWPQITTRELVMPDTNGGLLLTGRLQKFCQENRVRYETALRARAAQKGQIREQQDTNPTETSRLVEAAARTKGQATKATGARLGDEATRARLSAEIRRGLQAIGKSERDRDVIRRMEEFGSNNIGAMSEVQLKSFNDYIRQFADRRAALQKSAKPRPQTSEAA